ncbi:MAG: hypothetical protein QG597_4468 [Actinomycetota bacterium]|nr:hypothetical protein [Actinomycetota bacterium]
MSEQPTPAQVTEFVHAAVPAVGRLGIEVLDLSPGYTRLRVPLEGNSNHIGTMYAGALMALAELPGGLLPLAIPDLAVVPIVTDLQVSFVRAARTDATLAAHLDPDELRALAARAHAEGKAEFVLDTKAIDADGRTLMTCRGTYQLRPARG